LCSVGYLSDLDFNPVIGKFFRGRKLIIIFFLLVLFIRIGEAQSLVYPEIFGKDWLKAERFLNENRDWINISLQKYNIPYKEAISVVFPELVRYSALQDKIEITLLKALYINLGEEYANFSIGHFQMKPSFAEKIREAVNLFPEFENRGYLKNKSSYDDVKSYRASIVEDLEKPETEILYLIMYIKTCEKQFGTENMKEDKKIRFLATAYNYGFWMEKDRIVSMEDKKYFSTSLAGGVKYCYADVSLFWYNSVKSENKQ
jgi:hypothetical protein